MRLRWGKDTLPDIAGQSDYWNKTWNNRIHDDGRVSMNAGKYRFLLGQLAARPYLAPMEKLDVGCGTGIHAARMAMFNPLWLSRWTGIDLSQDAITQAKSFGLNAIYGNIYEWDGAGKKYGVFLFLDTLEHFFDHQRLGEKIIELAAQEYIIIGNIPLYVSKHSDACERPVDTFTLQKFFESAGCSKRKPTVYIYGINGLPYMFFETSNMERDYTKWTD